MTTHTWRAGRLHPGLAASRAAGGLTLALILAVCVAAADTKSPTLGGVAIAAAFAYVAVRVLKSWTSLIALLFFVIWFIPIKRYQLPVHLPFDLEPYRLMVGLLILIWVTALLLHRGIRLRSSGLELPLITFYLATLTSICVNAHQLERIGVEIDVLKTLSFFTSFLLVYFLIVSVTRTRRQLDFIIKALVGGGAVVAGSAIVEYRTGYNIFDHLNQVAPILSFSGPLTDVFRSDRLRVYASAQHPIALAAAFVMMIPLGIYLARSTRRNRWWVMTFLLGMGVFTTLSRTGVTMVIAEGIVFWRCRPGDAKRLLPLLLPAVIAVFLVLPNALGSLESAFFPQGGLVADQTAAGQVGTGYKNGRLATLGPSLHQWSKAPVFGNGGSRQLDPTNPNPSATNANILDDEWLDQLLAVGAVGFGALIWTIVRSTRRLGRLARSDLGPDGLLAGAVATSVVAFAVGAVTFDAFSFIQVAFLFYIVLALGASLLSVRKTEPRRLSLVDARPEAEPRTSRWAAGSPASSL